MIQVTASSSPILVSATGSTVSAIISAGQVAASASGGIGPQGIQGVQGPPGDALGASSDVVIEGVAAGDLLRYSSGKWRNHPEHQLIDGGAY